MCATYQIKLQGCSGSVADHLNDFYQTRSQKILRPPADPPPTLYTGSMFRHPLVRDFMWRQSVMSRVHIRLSGSDTNLKYYTSILLTLRGMPSIPLHPLISQIPDTLHSDPLPNFTSAPPANQPPPKNNPSCQGIPNDLRRPRIRHNCAPQHLNARAPCR